MADDVRDDHTIDPSHRLPLPEEQRQATLAEGFAHGTSPEDRALGASYVATNDDRELGREFSHPEYSDGRKVGASFADPNSLDDARLGRAFEESNSSRKKRHAPTKDRVHQPANRKVLWIFIVCALVLFGLIFLIGFLRLHSRNKETQKEADAKRSAEPVVEVAKVKRAQQGGGLVVPGTTNALVEAFVYARANGYLQKRFVDIGDHVRKGQLLAIIDAPDLDQQVEQAREQVRQTQAQLEQQRANLALAAVTVERYRVLVAKGVFSRQQGDQQEANYNQQIANVRAAERNVEAFKANLRRVIALQSYERVTAPFSGVITQRNVDVGALISASGSAGGNSAGPAPMGQASSSGGSQQSGQSNTSGSSGNANMSATPSGSSPGQGGPLFGIAQTERLRILVSVPEGYAGTIQPGTHAQLSFQEFPQGHFIGEVTRASGSIDQNSRTLLTEVQIDNHDGKLMPGMYAVATFPPSPGQLPLVVPGDAIAIRHDTSVVATVAQGKVKLVPVTLGRDYGPSVEVLAGLHDGDLIVTNVSDDVTEGAKVKTHMNAAQSEQQQQKPEQSRPPGGDSQYGNQGIADQNLQGKQTQQNQKTQGRQPKSDANSGSKP